MTKKLNDQLVVLINRWQQYQNSKQNLNALKSQTDLLYDIYTAHAEKVARELRKRNLTEVNTGEATFRLKREVNAKIIDRIQADEYDQRYKLGLFTKSICGPRVKSWATQQLEKNLKLPDFIEVLEVWTIDIS